MAHGHDVDADKVLRIAVVAMAASVGLDAERSTLYFDLVATSLSEAARKALQSMDPAKYEYQSEFARRYIAEGKAEGKAEGRSELLLKLLTLRFGRLPDDLCERIRTARIEEIEVFAERVLTATNLDQVFNLP
jgi:hypothetical protein